MRRYFGSDVPRLLGQNITKRTILLYVSAIVVATELWEPRYRVTKVDFDLNNDNPENLRAGRFAMTVRGVYYPRGQFGDFTPDPGEALLVITSGDQGIIFA